MAPERIRVDAGLDITARSTRSTAKAGASAPGTGERQRAALRLGPDGPQSARRSRRSRAGARLGATGAVNTHALGLACANRCEDEEAIGMEQLVASITSLMLACSTQPPSRRCSGGNENVSISARSGR